MELITEPTEEQKKEGKKIFKVANILLVLCLLVISITGALCLSGTVNLAGDPNFHNSSLKIHKAISSYLTSDYF
jgi:hypothetical protein